MRAFHNVRFARSPIIALCLLAGVTITSFAQMTTLPVVTIRATDPWASEAGDPGQFTLFRDGPTNHALTVYYHIGGSASNGVDYVLLPPTTTIPAGERHAAIAVNPIDDALAERTESVELHLLPPPAGITPYVVGMAAGAAAFILDDDGTNNPPWVQIVAPPNNAVFPPGADILICAHAGDLDGFVATVEFFAGDLSLGIRTNNPIAVDPRNPFCLVWSNAPVGEYVLTAKATDDDGASARSGPVNIAVRVPPTNLPPIVRLTAPPNGALFRAPVDIPIFAYARDLDGAVQTVEFLANATNSLGLGRRLIAGIDPVKSGTNMFVLVWSNAPLGEFRLTAKATDDDGAWAISEAVRIAVLGSPPPPTNHPAIVSIVATDPLAIEGTNCWPWVGLTNTTPTWSNWHGGTIGCRLFTNCGPKNATFTVRRDGRTNDPLVVRYEIGGAASNGVDYVLLPGAVTIPAGERRAHISIVPLDDDQLERPETVVLALKPSLTSPADYLLGLSRRAAAVIVDSLRPRPVSAVLPDHTFHLNASGPDGAWFRIEYSTDLAHWIPLCTNQVIQGDINFVDPDAADDQARFYRAVPEMNPPVD